MTDKSKILTEDELEKMLGAGSYWPPWIAEHRNAIRAHDALQRAEIERLRGIESAAREVLSRAPKNYEADCEYGDWGNSDDVYGYGVDTGMEQAANILRPALDAKEKS